ncbi:MULTISPECIES: DUF423 domain-containing protein [Pedobacter]|uniref:DUF423 domain-containing protein n=1 Tax=Pedobacter heparinus (strain ATCC 13125 / DSM 2366 / CIP 104194 / JCM 7457 / NBRC 12017 / NCIMB 9290 / NRRL B-14731 / HIM 762-3) TaxID=485917 RepID=C6XTX6_PEDHD|nr:MULTISPECIES: DUF423 domain-containing protein [Pedobacter]ACU03762.1 protein of unknown function DUF423 [Pedobacter heparinus DSM 2366]MBB5436717.1 uncharacterized membrane protein YgdD (TMEM256/DUF423 family) [Pedobacter sp. AK017]
MSRRILLTASLFGAIAVIFGAFGAHSLKNVLSSGSLEIWTKGVEYQFYHTFALLFLANYAAEGQPAKWAYRFFTLGIVLFSGSLYLLATRTILNIGFANLIGPVTPIGGLCFILGWAMLFFTVLKRK